MKQVIIILFLTGLLASGCTTESKAHAEARKAYLAGQAAAMQRMQAQSVPGVTVVGPVQNSNVPWVAGLTLAQALATANYVAPGQPSQITLIRNGVSENIDPNNLDQAAQIILQPGDAIMLQQ